MKKVVIVFGLISGAISSAMMFLTLPFIKSGAINNNGEIIGYTAILLSSCWSSLESGRIARTPAARSRSAAPRRWACSSRSSRACSMSPRGEIIYFKLMPDFGDKYAARAIDTMREKGVTDAAVAAKKKEMEAMKAMLDNPLINVAVTFIEPLPVGLIVTLVSAAILRKRTPTPTPGVAQGVSP